MTPIIITLSLLIPSQLGRKKSGTELGTGYGGTVCGFHTRPFILRFKIDQHSATQIGGAVNKHHRQNCPGTHDFDK